MRSRLGLAGICSAFLVFAGVPGALAQSTSGIFITPVPDAPFTGVIKIDRTIVQADGKVESLKTIRDTARDSRGRIYNVFRALVPADFSGTPPTIRVHFPSSSSGSEVVLVDEYWYSEDLHMNVMVKHSDPRKGSVTMTLTQATRTDPDPSLFQIPEGYKPADRAMARAQ